MYSKVHRYNNEVLVAVCDQDLLGKVFRDEERNLRLEISSDFYNGDLIDEEVLIGRLKQATIANFTGERCIKVASRLDLIETILYIDGIPHAQVICFDRV